MEVIQLREDERPEAIILELLKGADNAMQVDCADRRTGFTVHGYFVFPSGSLVKRQDIDGPS